MSRRVRTTPTFADLQSASTNASRAMRKNRKHDTRHEVLLRRALWKLGLRFRKHAGWLPGNPDIAFTKAKVAVFCDGDFWHGRNWELRRLKLKRGHNASYWIKKLENNMRRDELVTRELVALGWCVIRLWETDVLRSPEQHAENIRDVVRGRPPRGRDNLHTPTD